MVEATPWRCDVAACRGDLRDDAADGPRQGVDSAHYSESVFCDVHCGPEVDLEEVAAGFDGRALELAEQAIASIVDHHVNSAEFGEGGIEGGADGGLGS